MWSALISIQHRSTCPENDMTLFYSKFVLLPWNRTLSMIWKAIPLIGCPAICNAYVTKQMRKGSWRRLRFEAKCSAAIRAEASDLLNASCVVEIESNCRSLKMFLCKIIHMRLKLGGGLRFVKACILLVNILEQNFVQSVRANILW